MNESNDNRAPRFDIFLWNGFIMQIIQQSDFSQPEWPVSYNATDVSVIFFMRDVGFFKLIKLGIVKLDSYSSEKRIAT